MLATVEDPPEWTVIQDFARQPDEPNRIITNRGATRATTSCPGC